MTRLTKYEEAKVIGVRVEMLARGAKPLIPVEGDHLKRGDQFDIRLIAEEELRQGVLPFEVSRQTSSATVNVRLHRS